MWLPCQAAPPGDASLGTAVGVQEACVWLQEQLHDPTDPRAPDASADWPQVDNELHVGRDRWDPGSMSVASRGCEFTSKVALEGFQKCFPGPIFRYRLGSETAASE